MAFIKGEEERLAHDIQAITDTIAVLEQRGTKSRSVRTTIYTLGRVAGELQKELSAHEFRYEQLKKGDS